MTPAGSLLEIELCEELRRHPAIADRVEAMAADTLAALTDRLGIPAPDSVVQVPSRSRRAVRIVVDGQVCPSPLTTLRRTWLTCASPDLHDLPLTDLESTSGDPDHWLRPFVAEGSSDSSDGRTELAVRFISRLVAETLAQRPGCLLSEAAAVTYLDPGAERFAPHEARDILRELLNLGVSLRGHDEVAPLAQACRDAGGSPEQIVEELFGRLADRTVHVRVDVEWVEDDVPDPAGAKTLRLGKTGTRAGLHSISKAVEQRMRKLGITRRVRLEVDETLERGEIIVTVNDRRALPILVARMGETAVQYPPSVVPRSLNIGRLLIDPASGHRLVALPEAEAEAIRSQELTPVGAEAYLAVAIVRELVPFADQLLDIADVEADLADVERSHPELVHAVLRYHRPDRLARIFRALLVEQVGLSDMWLILNGLLRYGAVPLCPSGRRLFDDRVPVEDPTLSVAETPIRDLVSFIRLQLKGQIVAERRVLSTDTLELPVYSIDPQLEQELVTRDSHDGRSDSVSADRDDELRLSIGRGLALAGSPADALLLVSPSVRVPLQRLVASEFPAVRVITDTEVPPDLSPAVQGVVGS